MKRILLVLAVQALFESVAFGADGDYGYPIDSAVLATVVGTPEDVKAELPKDTGFKPLTLRVPRDLEVPDVFWYDRALRYGIALQDHPAPLMFTIAGTGAGFNDSSSRLLRGAFFKAGFHVVSLSSPTYQNFIVAASSSGVPGHTARDAEDLYRVMGLTLDEVRRRGARVTKFHLSGYSLGAMNAAFVAALDEAEQRFDFHRVLLINPPWSLYDSVRRLDRMIEDSPDYPDMIPMVIGKFIHRIATVYREASPTTHGGAPLDLSSGALLLAVYNQYRPPEERVELVIGIVFRILYTNMAFPADVMSRAGFVVPRNLELTNRSSLTEYLKVIARTNFIHYFDDLFIPYFRNQDPSLTREDLIRQLSLEPIRAYLSQSDKIGVVTNADDIILGARDLRNLEQVFGDRLKVYPKGGHLGNMGYRDNVRYMIDFFLKGQEPGA